MSETSRAAAQPLNASASLAELLDPDVLADPYPLYARLRSEDPIHWDLFLHAWVVTRYADVAAVLADFSSARTPSPEKLASIGLVELSPIAEVMVRFMLFRDPPAHTRIRELASSAFTPQRVAIIREHVRDITNALLDAVEASGRMDVIADLADPLPYTITAEMLGVPVADAPQLKQWSLEFAEMLGNFEYNPEGVTRVRATIDVMTQYFRDAIAVVRKHPRPGLIQSFLDANVDGDRFTEDEVVANTMITMVGGQETTTNLIGNGLLTLLRHPVQFAQLRSDVSLLPSAIEEMLRYEPPIQHTARLTFGEMNLGAKMLGKQQAVIAVLAAGNRDPERFAEPDRFDITRRDNRHLSFGWGPHYCFGAALARMEAQVAFELLLGRFKSIRLEPGPQHWRTNLGFRGLKSLRIAFE